MRKIALASLVAAALVLPFELIKPLGRVGPLVLTTVELVLYVAIALGAAVAGGDLLRGISRRTGRLDWRGFLERHGAAVGFVAVSLLSAARAPVGGMTPLKFALRSASGVALYLTAAHLLRAPGAVWRAAGGLTAGAVVAGLLMWSEIHLPGTAAWLTPFHVQTFEVFGLARASGPFQYPNIAAMYLEAVIPVALALGVAIDARRVPPAGTDRAGHEFTVAGAVVALVLAGAVSLTSSRAGVATVALVLGGIAVFAGIRRTPLRSAALGALGAAALLAIASVMTNSLVGLRLKFWQDQSWYRSTIVPVQDGAARLPARLEPGATARVDVDVRNTGARPWPASGEQTVGLSYHWRQPGSGAMIVFDGLRTPLPADLPAGAGARLHALIRAPVRPGRYGLHIDLGHEGVTWFSERGDPGFRAIVEVSDPAAAPVVMPQPPPVAAAPPPAAAPPAVPLESLSRSMLWQAAFRAWRQYPVLGLGPDNFRHVYQRYSDTDVVDARFHANNSYLEILANLGLAGVAIFAGLLVSFWRSARRALRAHDARSAEGLLAVGIAAGLAAYLIHGLFDYFLEFTPTYALFWLLAAMLSALGEKTEATVG